MSSRIEQIIEEIEEYVDSCKFQPLSSTKIVVNKEELEELLRQKKNEELEKLSDALEEAGVSVDEVLAQLKTDVQENIA